MIAGKTITFLLVRVAVMRFTLTRLKSLFVLNAIISLSTQQTPTVDRYNYNKEQEGEALHAFNSLSANL